MKTMDPDKFKAASERAVLLIALALDGLLEVAGAPEEMLQPYSNGIAERLVSYRHAGLLVRIHLLKAIASKMWPICDDNGADANMDDLMDGIAHVLCNATSDDVVEDMFEVEIRRKANEIIEEHFDA